MPHGRQTSLSPEQAVDRLEVMHGDASNAQRDALVRFADGGPPPDAAPPVAADDAPPDLFAAMQQQLGLKMGTTKAPVDVMVIDKVDKPSEN